MIRKDASFRNNYLDPSQTDSAAQKQQVPNACDLV